jgi:hypothetical protein
MKDIPTPKTDRVFELFNQKACSAHYVAHVMGSMEIELALANEHIRRLTEAGDAIIENGSVSERLLNNWNEAKRDLP